MLVLNEAQALVVEGLLTKMLLNETYSVSELEEALSWFQRETDRVSCPFERVWSQNLAQEIVRALRSQG
ncbi:MAG: hypothetical protein LH660_00110 [Phormidesmis sp. CAN_BIN36]|nr:hypothetical protein [Phormidesmis sp. CAN_BIN36]